MNLDIVKSVNNVPIRLTFERWFEHIVERHSYMKGYYDDVLEAVENPEFILRGHKGSKIAVRSVGRRQWLHVIYREINQEDGFIIASFIDESYNKNLIIWQSK
ncbi:hypothetical protein BH20ACI1_BH20ACI1_25330 [soil metagenome]